jgi:hypothetical protein
VRIAKPLSFLLTGCLFGFVRSRAAQDIRHSFVAFGARGDREMDNNFGAQSYLLIT